MAGWWKRGAVALAVSSVLAGGMATLAASPAAADVSGVAGPICWYKGLGYSEGAVERMDGIRHLCVRNPDGTGTWQPMPG